MEYLKTLAVVSINPLNTKLRKCANKIGDKTFLVILSLLIGAFLAIAVVLVVRHWCNKYGDDAKMIGINAGIGSSLSKIVFHEHGPSCF